MAKSLVLDKLIKTLSEKDSEIKFKSFLNTHNTIVDVRDNNSQTALHRLVKSGGKKEVVKMLLMKAPKLIDAVDNMGKTALHLAAERGNEKIVELLLKKNPTLINAVDNLGLSALQGAAVNSYEKVVKFLLPRMDMEAIKSVADDDHISAHIRGIINKYIKTKMDSVEQEKVTNINQNILAEVNELVKEANDKIQHPIEKGILLLGKTGSGKSTLATIMAGRKLQAIKDEEEGVLVIDALNPLKDIIISNSKVAETRIPNKCNVKDIVIWDCPGFHDNRGIAQEIANGFYIKRLLETTKAVKFILVIPESALYANRGVDFIDTVNQLMRSFTNVDTIDGSISLVITGVPQGIQPTHILKSIERITNQNELLTQEIVKIIGYLKQSVHVFHKPIKEGPLEIEYDFLEEINKKTKYAIDASDYALISISEQSIGYVQYILQAAQEKFSEIVNIVLKTVSESNGSINSNNRLSYSYKLILKLLPESMAQLSSEYMPEHKDNKTSKYFTEIMALSSMQEAFDTNFEISMINTCHALKFFNNILQSCEEYIGSGSRQQETLKLQIRGYTYALNQQMEYIKFFSKLCGQEISLYLNTLKQPLVLCKEAISKNLEEAVKSIAVVQNHTDSEYYKTALKYLELYPLEEWSTKTQAKIHLYLADLSEYDDALGHCLKSMNLDKTLPTSYSKLGDLLFKAKDYKSAIGCFKAINNNFKVEQCYKKMLKANPENPELTLEAADYFASIGIYSKAVKLYHHAFSFSQDEDFKAVAWQKISHIMDGNQERAEVLAEKAINHDFYDFDSVDMDSLQALIGGCGDDN